MTKRRQEEKFKADLERERKRQDNLKKKEQETQGVRSACRHKYKYKIVSCNKLSLSTYMLGKAAGPAVNPQQDQSDGDMDIEGAQANGSSAHSASSHSDRSSLTNGKFKKVK